MIICNCLSQGGEMSGCKGILPLKGNENVKDERKERKDVNVKELKRFNRGRDWQQR